MKYNLEAPLSAAIAPKDSFLKDPSRKHLNYAEGIKNLSLRRAVPLRKNPIQLLFCRFPKAVFQLLSISKWTLENRLEIGTTQLA